MSAGVIVPYVDNEPEADDQGLISWSMDNAGCGNSTALPTAGTVYLVRMLLNMPKVLSAPAFVVTAAGAALTAGQCFAGIYDANGVLLGTSADISAAMAATGLLKPALVTPAQAAAGFVYSAILFNGTTGPSLLAGAGLTAGGISIGNVNLAAAAARYLAGPAGQTSLPATINLAAQSMNVPATWWAGVA